MIIIHQILGSLIDRNVSRHSVTCTGLREGLDVVLWKRGSHPVSPFKYSEAVYLIRLCLGQERETVPKDLRYTGN